MRVYLARRLDWGNVVEFEDDPEKVPPLGGQVWLPLDPGAPPILCERIYPPPQVVATDRRKRFDEAYQRVRSDGRLSTMQLPTRENVRAQGLPEAPYYNGNGEASFMNREQARDYGKRLADSDPSGGHEFDP